MHLLYPCFDTCSAESPSVGLPEKHEAFSIGEIGNEGCVATVGFFDGVHRGHRFLLEKLTALAHEKGLPSLVISFWPHPQAVVGKACPPLLTDCSEKVALLRQAGVDHTVIVPFTQELSQLSAQDFMEKVLRDTYHVKCLLMGYDHRFGRKGETPETFEDYRQYGESLGIEVVHEEALSATAGHEGTPFKSHIPIGSSAIREALLKHDIESANAALGYPYAITGRVERGFENGHKLGFPTANVVPDAPEKLVPANGVYAVEVMLEETDHTAIEACCQSKMKGPYKGMLNIGCRPTLHNGTKRSIEVNIFDFNENIYGRPIKMAIHHFVREERTFLSTEALTEQLNNDRETVRDFFRLNPPIQL